MRLLRIQDGGTYELIKYPGKDIPPYAILSHTWGHDDDEVSFTDIENGKYKDKPAYVKLRFCADQALKDNLNHFWVDTCCINKASDSELSSSLNSMFRWYRDATKCYVYLSDVSFLAGGPKINLETALKESRWFKRGWTLQELIAPPSVQFFSQEGTLLGDKISLKSFIHELTKIPTRAFCGAPLSEFTIPERISWAAKRETTLEEDQVYCLFGIFSVYLPIIYGEGVEHAMRRLRREIPETSHDAGSALADDSESCLANLAGVNQTLFISRTLERSKSSCAWLLMNKEYNSWIQDRNSSVLLMTTRAGCGKTTVAAHVSRMVAADDGNKVHGSRSRFPQPLVLSFFFRKSSQDTERNAAAALRSITRQLVDKDAKLLSVLLRRHHQLSAKGSFDWTWDHLVGVLREMWKNLELSPPVYIIVDAIDECDETSRWQFLDWARSLVDNTFSRDLVPSIPITKLLLTSRPHTEILDHLYGVPTVAFTGTETANDMKSLISTRAERLAQRRHLSPTIIDSISRFLEMNAQGMFLWVVLIFEELERRDERLTDNVIASKLKSIPLTLAETYTAVLRRTPQERQLDMWRIIRWLLYARRDLTIVELEAGLAIETDSAGWLGFTGDLEYLCGSLVRIDGPDEEISFIHQTTRGYLENLIARCTSADFAGLEMESQAAHEHLATICVRYLLKDMEKDFMKFLELLSAALWSSHARGYNDYRETIDAFIAQHPFLRYAIQSWDFHFRASGAPHAFLIQLAISLLSSKLHRACILILTWYIQKHGSLRAPSQATPLHLASYFNLENLTHHFLTDEKIPVDVVGRPGDTPLVWASEMGSTECVKILLQAGANPNKFEYDGWSALHWAARNGHVEVLKLLLDYGALIDPTDSAGHTPLDWAFDRGFSLVVEILTQRTKGGLKCDLDQLLQSRNGATTPSRLSTTNRIRQPFDAKAQNDEKASTNTFSRRIGSAESSIPNMDSNEHSTRATRSARAWKLWDLRP